MCMFHVCADFILQSYHVSGALFANFDGVTIEFHVRSELEGADGHAMSRRLRIAHIVIRPPPWEDYTNRIASIEAPMLALPRLETLTLETIDKEDSAELAERLATSRKRGILRRRTCKESWEIAQEAFKNPGSCSEEQGVVSPLWFTDCLGIHKLAVPGRWEQWYVVIS